MPDHIYPPQVNIAATSMSEWTLGPEATLKIDGGTISLSEVAIAGLSKLDTEVLLAKRRLLDGIDVGPMRVHDHTRYWLEMRIGREATDNEVVEAERQLLTRSRGWLMSLGYNPDAPGISADEALLRRSPSRDYAFVVPELRLFALADGAGDQGYPISRFVPTRVGEHAIMLAPSELSAAPSGFNKDQARLWTAVNTTDRDVALAKDSGRLDEHAATTLVMAKIGRLGITVFNAGDSRALWVNHDARKVQPRPLTTEQSTGTGKLKLANAICGLYRKMERPYSANLAESQDEIITYGWDELLGQGEIGTLGLVSDGLTGNDGPEVVSIKRLGLTMHGYYMNGLRVGPMAKRLVEGIGQALDDRQALMVRVKRN